MLEGVISEEGINSTTVPLSGGGIFEGTYEDVHHFSSVVITVFSDVPSTFEGLRLIWSNDGETDHFDDEPYTYNVLDPFLVPIFGAVFTSPINGNFFRLTYANDVDPQTVFSLKTIFHYGPSEPRRQAAGDIADVFSETILTKSLVVGEDLGTGALRSAQWEASKQTILVSTTPSTEFPGTQAVSIVNTPIGISGTVSIGNIPTVLVQGPVAVSGNVNTHILDLPKPIGVSGTVSANVLALPLPVGVSGTVTANQGGAPWSVNVVGQPIPIGVSGTVSAHVLDLPNPIGVSGTVSVNAHNVFLPLPVGVSGTVSAHVLDLPNPIGVSGTVTANQGGAPWSVVGTLTTNNLAPGTNNIGVLPGIANAIPPVLTENRQSLLSMDLAGNLRTTLPTVNLLNETTVAIRHNQVEVNFSQPTFDASAVTNTTANGGTATQSNGEGVYSTGTSGTCGASGTSVQGLLYRPGSEAYAYFTAAFTTPTSSGSFQRIGPYIGTDGFFIGYEGLTFKATVRQNNVNTGTAQASFNSDKLDGASGTKFTRAGIAEAIDWTKLNVFRIRWSWFGAAPILFEVLSPDGIWVIFHTIRQPNTSNLPSITQSNLNMQVEVNKIASDATNLIIRTACWAAGMTVPEIRITDTITDNTLAPINRSVIVGHTTAGGGSYVNVKVNPSGALSADVTQGTSPWAVSGTVTANQGSPPWNIQGDVASGTVDSGNPVKIGGLASTSRPAALPNGQRQNAYFTPNGELVIWNGSRLDPGNDEVVVSGRDAHDSPDTGYPIKIGGKALSGSPVAVQDGDRVNAWFDLVGRPIVMNYGQTKTSVPVVSLSPAYTAGDNVGGLLTIGGAVLTSGGFAVIETVVLSDSAKQSAALDIVFFDSNPSASTFTDNGALTITSGDITRIIGHVPILATDYTNFVTNSVATIRNVQLFFTVVSTTTIYAAIVARGTPTYTNASSLNLRVVIKEC